VAVTKAADSKQRTAKKPSKKREILVVQILEAKPNPMFTEEQRAAVRFLRFNQTVPCAECGHRRKVMWTMLCEFYAHSLSAPPGLPVLGKGKKHAPLTPVCGDHPLGPAWPEDEAEEAQS
jgi:hypothetical protein